MSAATINDINLIHIAVKDGNIHFHFTWQSLINLYYIENKFILDSVGTTFNIFNFLFIF